MRDLFYATPWWLLVLLGLVAIALIWTGNQRQNRNLLIAGLALGLLALVLLITSLLFETDVERVERQTREMIEAVEAGEWRTLRELMDPTASLGVADGRLSIYQNRDDIVYGAQTAAEQFGLRAVRIRSMESRQTQTLITVTVRAWSEQDATLDRPLPSEWQLDWQQMGDEWLLQRITLMELAQRPGRDVSDQIPAR
jgi:hypothetical protein